MTRNPTWRELHAALPTLREQHHFLYESMAQTEASIAAACDPIISAFRVNFDMSPQQARIAARLYRSRGEYVPREALFAAGQISHNAQDAGKHLEVVIHHIRRRLRGGVLSVDTLQGEGYCMNGPDTLSEVKPASPSKAPTAGGADE